MSTRQTEEARGAYSIEDIARRVNVSVKVVRRWAWQGRIPGTFRAGKQWRFDRLAVEKRILGGSLLLDNGQ